MDRPAMIWTLDAWVELDHLRFGSLCAFCREVVPTKPFTNTALYYKPPTRYSFISSTAQGGGGSFKK